jgi:hypothetical protein
MIGLSIDEPILLKWALYPFASFGLFVAAIPPDKLIFRTSGDDQQVHQSWNKTELGKLKDAVERAIELRG